MLLRWPLLEVAPGVRSFGALGCSKPLRGVEEFWRGGYHDPATPAETKHDNAVPERRLLEAPPQPPAPRQANLARKQAAEPTDNWGPVAGRAPAAEVLRGPTEALVGAAQAAQAGQILLCEP